MFYDGVPVLVLDFQPDNETADNGTGSTFSSIYGIQFLAADGVVGLTNGGLEVIDIGQLESKDGTRVRVRWYVGLAVLRDSAVFRINGLNAAKAVGFGRVRWAIAAGISVAIAALNGGGV